MSSPDAFSKSVKLKKLLSNTSDEILTAKSQKILTIFSDDIQPILTAFAYSPFVISDQQFNEIINILTPQQQIKTTNTNKNKLNINDLSDDSISNIFQFLPLQTLINLELTSLRFMFIARSKNTLQSINLDHLHKIFQVPEYQHFDYQLSMIFDRFKKIKKLHFLEIDVVRYDYKDKLYAQFLQKFFRDIAWNLSSRLTHLSVSHDSYSSIIQMQPNMIFNGLLSLKILGYDSITEEEMNLILSKAPNIETLECEELYASNLRHLSQIKTLCIRTDDLFYFDDDANKNISDMMPNIKKLECYQLLMNEDYINLISNLDSLTCSYFILNREDDDDDDDDDDDMMIDDENKQTFYQQYIGANTNQQSSLQYFKFSEWSYYDDGISLFVASCIIKKNHETLKSLHVNAHFFEQLHESLNSFIDNNNTIITLNKVIELSVELNDTKNKNLIGSLYANKVRIGLPNLKKICVYMNQVNEAYNCRLIEFKLDEFYDTLIKYDDIKLECLEIYGPSNNVLNQIFAQTIPKIIAGKKDKYIYNKESPLNINIIVSFLQNQRLIFNEMMKCIEIIKSINNLRLLCKMRLTIDMEKKHIADQFKDYMEKQFVKWNCDDYKWHLTKCVVSIY